MSETVESFLKSAQYVKIFFALLFLVVVTLPFVREMWSREYRQMLNDMKGENSRWEWSEIWEYNSLRFAKGFFSAIIFMILMKTLFDIEYSWELYVLVFLGTLGSNGLGAFLIYIKAKHEK